MEGRRLWGVFAFLCVFFLVHMAKMSRMYLVLLEQKIPFRRLLWTYLKTTFVNLVIPFKMGECYRIYCYAKDTKVFQIGLFSVGVDRFFDTVGLLLLLIPFELFFTRDVTRVTGLLLVVLLFLVFIYRIFLPTYLYLNRYFILHKSSPPSMKALQWLDKGKDWFDYVKELISGRYSLILIASMAGWGMEILALLLLSFLIGKPFGMKEFSNYIGAIFLMEGSILLKIYTLAGTALIGGSMVMMYGGYRWKECKKGKGIGVMKR